MQPASKSEAAHANYANSNIQCVMLFSISFKGTSKIFHLKKLMKNDAIVAIPAALVLKAAIIIITDLYALECHGKYGR